MSKPLVHRGDRERVADLPSGTPLDVETLQNLIGDLAFQDASNPLTTLTQILSAGNGGEARTSGVVNQGSGSLLVLDPLTIRVKAGNGEKLIERQAGAIDIEHDVDWIETDITVVGKANLASYYVIQDAGFTGTGVPIELSSLPSAATLRANSWIFLGMSIHSGSTVVAKFDAPSLYNDQGFLLEAIVELIGGTRRKSGNMVEIGSTLTMQTEETVLFSKGGNFHTDPLDPHDITIAASPGAVTFNVIDGAGVVLQGSVSSHLKQWNNAGVLTALTGKTAVVHQVAVLPSGDIEVQAGITAYKDYQTAVASVGIEKALNPLWVVADVLGGTYGVAILAADATIWEDSKAHLFAEQDSGGGSSVGGVTDLLGLADTPDTYIGADSQVLVVNNAEDGTRFGKIRTQIMIAVPENFDASSSAQPDVALPAHINAFRFIIDNVHCEVKTAPTTIALQVDVTIAGATIFAGPLPTIATSATVGQLAPTITDHFQGDRIRVDIAAGDAVWNGLTVTLEGWSEPE